MSFFLVAASAAAGQEVAAAAVAVVWQQFGEGCSVVVENLRWWVEVCSFLLSPGTPSSVVLVCLIRAFSHCS